MAGEDGGAAGGAGAGVGKEEDQDGMSAHSPCKAPPSSASSLSKEQLQVELELRFLEALAIYPPGKLKGIHRHFVLYGLMEYLRRSFDRQFTSEEVLQLLDRFYNLDMVVELQKVGISQDLSSAPLEPRVSSATTSLSFGTRKADDEDAELLNREEDFSLPKSYFVKEEP